MDSWKKDQNVLSKQMENSPQNSQKHGMWGKNTVYVTVGETQNAHEDIWMQEIQESTPKEGMADIQKRQMNDEEKKADSWKEEKRSPMEVYKEENENSSDHAAEPNMSAQNMPDQNRGCFVNGVSQQRNCQFPSMCMQNRSDAMMQCQYMGNMKSSNMRNPNTEESYMQNGMANKNMAGMRMGNGMAGCMKDGNFTPLEASENFTIGMGYVPMQHWEQTYDMADAIKRGTMFPSLDLPFMMGRCR